MDGERIVLIHLSDIHFHRHRSGGVYDLDKDMRNELERDAEKMRDRLGNVHGILVTGDIAFAGKQEEYDIALEWLKRLCGRVGCLSENVWTTPGNHDVDRSVIKNSHLLQTIHQQLRSKDPRDIDTELRGWLVEDTVARSLLFQPIENYVEFASKFECQIDPDFPYWEHDLKLNDGSTLRLRGLNSTLVSDHLDNNAEYKLILGSAQCTLIREDGVEYMTLCHHPPQWLRDQDTVGENLNARARIQLFGHKHHQRVEQINNTLRLTAGAVHPDRGEVTWQPRYNYITLFVNGQGESRRLEVDVYPRVWDDTEKLFKADHDSKGSDCRSFSLPMEPWKSLTPSQVSIPDRDVIQEPAKSEPAAPENRAADSLGSGTMDASRRLTHRFLTLPYHERIEIAQKLHLLQDEDNGVQDAELFKRFFRRAKERELLEQLWDEVERHHHDGRQAENPFAKHQALEG